MALNALKVGQADFSSESPKFGVGETISSPYGKGKVKSNDDGGVTVELENGATGYLHESSLSKAVATPVQKTPQEQLSDALASKAAGNDFYKAKDYTEALKQYRKCVIVLQRYLDRSKLSDEEKKEADQAMLAGHLNMAQCMKAIGKPGDAAKLCSVAIRLDANNENGTLPKSLVRRGQAFFADKEYSKAAKDLSDAHKLIGMLRKSGKATNTKALVKVIADLHPQALKEAKAAKERDAKKWSGFLNDKPDALSSNGAEAGASSPSKTTGKASSGGATTVNDVTDLTSTPGDTGVDGEGGRAVSQAAGSAPLWIAGTLALGLAITVGYIWMRGKR